MSSIDLIILGFIKNDPMSAYDITRHMEFKKVQKWVKIGAPTIYQNIKKLAAKGFLDGTVVREGEMPEKVVYAVTKAGEARFLELMNHYADTPGRLFFDFNAVIANLGHVNNETALAMLGRLKKNFEASLADVNADYEERGRLPQTGIPIMELYQSVFSNMVDWVDKLEKQYQEQD